MTDTTRRRNLRRASISSFRLSAGATVVLTALCAFSASAWAQDPPPSRCSDERTLPPAQLSAKDTALLDVGDSLGNFRESFPTLTAYFDAAYETVATQTFDDRFGVTLLVRRGRQGGTFDLLGWPCPAVPTG